MDYAEALMEVAKMMKAQTDAITQYVDHKVDAMEQRVTIQMNEQTRHIDLKIENEISRRIDVLFDGYKQNRDKQTQVEQAVEVLTEQFEEVELRVRRLEGKIA